MILMQIYGDFLGDLPGFFFFLGGGRALVNIIYNYIMQYNDRNAVYSD